MELLGFLIVIVWALPMFVSVIRDNDAITTLTGIMISNIGALLILYLSTELQSLLSLPKSELWLLIYIPILISAYWGIWALFSDSFLKFLKSF